VLGDPITPHDLDGFQPHQVRKKQALSARFTGLTAAGFPIIDTPGLRLDELGKRLSSAARKNEIAGTIKRAREGRIAEPLPAT
jgi:coenzyme F420 hydrogenase subunit beta